MRTASAGLLAAAALALTAAPGLAHPFGPPPTALVSARGHTVLVEWAAAADDAIAVGEAIGVFDEGTAQQYWEAPVQVAPPERKEEELSASPALRDYLLERIQVRQDGALCEGRVEPIANFVRDGAQVAYRCHEPVEVVDVRITMLHDVHEAYRTFAVSDGDAQPPQAAFTVARSEHRWDFAAAPEPGRPGETAPGVAWWPVLAGGVLAALVAGVLVAAASRGR